MLNNKWLRNTGKQQNNKYSLRNEPHSKNKKQKKKQSNSNIYHRLSGDKDDKLIQIQCGKIQEQEIWHQVNSPFQRCSRKSYMALHGTCGFDCGSLKSRGNSWQYMPIHCSVPSSIRQKKFQVSLLKSATEYGIFRTSIMLHENKIWFVPEECATI